MGNSDILKRYLTVGLMPEVSLAELSRKQISGVTELKAKANDLALKYVLATDISLNGELVLLATEKESYKAPLYSTGHMIRDQLNCKHQQQRNCLTLTSWNVMFSIMQTAYVMMRLPVNGLYS